MRHCKRAAIALQLLDSAIGISIALTQGLVPLASIVIHPFLLVHWLDAIRSMNA